MTIAGIFSLLGGLGLFLYGMHMTSEGLENAAGNKLKTVLEKLTSNRFIGVLIGALITAIIQSSSATTVMVVGFVNSGLMTLTQAVWIIMGANIGTTITGQLLTLNVNEIAPLFIFVGVVMVTFFKKKKINYIGSIIAGLGIIFVGMHTMSSAMSPLRDYQPFLNLLSSFKNPFMGLFTGCAFTAVIQSSAASVGILQALAKSGIITLNSAFYVLLGQNIGTCVTAVLASIGTKKNAKRATLIHLSFNIIGTIIFVIASFCFPLIKLLQETSPSVVAQIANTHTIFNIATTIILLPFGTLLVKLVEKILPVDETENDKFETIYIHSAELRARGTSSANLIEETMLKKEVFRMFGMVSSNFFLTLSDMVKLKDKNDDRINYNEKYIDYIHKQIVDYCSHAPSDSDYNSFMNLYKVSDLVERIGDRLINLREYTDDIVRKELTISPQAQTELTTLQEVISDQLNEIKEEDTDLKKVSDNEELVDQLINAYRNNQIDRLKANEVDPDGCVIYSEILTDIERIGDHIYTIAKLLNGQDISFVDD